MLPGSFSNNDKVINVGNPQMWEIFQLVLRMQSLLYEKQDPTPTDTNSKYVIQHMKSDEIKLVFSTPSTDFHVYSQRRTRMSMMDP